MFYGRKDTNIYSLTEIWSAFPSAFFHFGWSCFGLRHFCFAIVAYVEVDKCLWLWGGERQAFLFVSGCSNLFYSSSGFRFHPVITSDINTASQFPHEAFFCAFRACFFYINDRQWQWILRAPHAILALSVLAHVPRKWSFILRAKARCGYGR